MNFKKIIGKVDVCIIAVASSYVKYICGINIRMLTATKINKYELKTKCIR